MVDPSTALDRVFHALASAPRREILRRVLQERCTVTQLAAGFDMSLAAVSKHVRVLADADLVRQAREGRRHWCLSNPAALEPARASIDELRGFWEGRLDGLERLLAGDPPGPAAPRSVRRSRRPR